MARASAQQFVDKLKERDIRAEQHGQDQQRFDVRAHLATLFKTVGDEMQYLEDGRQEPSRQDKESAETGHVRRHTNKLIAA
jgi:fumarylacetoacetate (FAA) hydrolase family protein